MIEILKQKFCNHFSLHVRSSIRLQPQNKKKIKKSIYNVRHVRNAQNFFTTQY